MKTAGAFAATLTLPVLVHRVQVSRLPFHVSSPQQTRQGLIGRERPSHGRSREQWPKLLQARARARPYCCHRASTPLRLHSPGPASAQYTMIQALSRVSCGISKLCCSYFNEIQSWAASSLSNSYTPHAQATVSLTEHPASILTTGRSLLATCSIPLSLRQGSRSNRICECSRINRICEYDVSISMSIGCKYDFELSSRRTGYGRLPTTMFRPRLRK